MSTGPRPWLGTPIKTTIAARAKRMLVLTFEEDVPPSMGEGDEYVVVFSSYNSNNSGDPEKPKDS